MSRDSTGDSDSHSRVYPVIDLEDRGLTDGGHGKKKQYRSTGHCSAGNRHVFTQNGLTLKIPGMCNVLPVRCSGLD